MTVRPRLFRCCAAAAAVAALLPSPAWAEMEGVWVNPRGSIAVQTRTCDGKLCGRIVWANAEAREDAKESGIDNPVGIELPEDYRRARDGSWHGLVYVPDMGRTFHSTIVALAPDRLKISGCLIGNFICKSQIWHKR